MPGKEVVKQHDNVVAPSGQWNHRQPDGAEPFMKKAFAVIRVSGLFMQLPRDHNAQVQLAGTFSAGRQD